MKKILFIATLLCLAVTAVADTPTKKQFANGFIEKIDGIIEREFTDARSDLRVIRCALPAYYDIDMLMFAMKVYLIENENARLHEPWHIDEDGYYEAAVVLNGKDVVMFNFNYISKKLRIYYLDLDNKNKKF